MLNTARVLVVGVLASVILTATVVADHSWGSYHWARTANPFTLKVGDNVSSVWDGHLDTAIADWNGSSVLALTKETGGVAKARNCRPTVGRIEVCSYRYGQNGWLGIAQIWISGDHITQAITKLNDTYFSTTTYNTPAWRDLVMCQEIGHDFGLDHQDETFDNSNLDSCMDYTNNPESNRHPNAHDYEELEAIYAHFDSTTTAAATKHPNGMPPAMGQIAFDTPAQWGRRIHASPNGRREMYEQDFGRGHKVITHVYWADPAADAH
ncbi:MAG: hypothetical protein ACRD3C_17880 [Vicinamibacterales bacterium]